MSRRQRVLLVSGSGGVLLDLLALRPWWRDHDTAWAAVRAADTEVALADQDVIWLPRRPQPRALPATWRALRLLRGRRPDLIVSAGADEAPGMFLAARLLRIPAVWVEPLTATGRPTAQARFCGRLAAAVLVQRPGLVTERPRAVLVGELY
jgi:hypothetical protein